MTRVCFFLAVPMLAASIVLPTTNGQEKVIPHGHTDGIMSLAFSPDGKLLATGGCDHVIHLWGSDNGKRVRTLTGHPGNVSCVAFSPDGKTLASGSYAARRSDFSLMLWNVKTGEKLHGIPAASSFDVYAVCFSPDGRTVVTGGDDWLINFWDVRSGKGRMVRRHGVVTSLILCPNGKQFVVSGRSKTVSLINSVSGEIIRTFSGHTDSVWYLDLSSDGKTLVSADEKGTVKFWGLTNGKLLHSIEDAGIGAKLSKDGRFLATIHRDSEMKSPDTVRVFNRMTGERLTELRGHERSINGLSFSPDGKHLAFGDFSSIRIWEISEFTAGR
jgi:WD40 repeat protein